jgi:hypothetical protein
MWRSSDGKTRIDMPQSSVISDPISKHTIVLDHLKKEASIIPVTPPGSQLCRRARSQELLPPSTRRPCKCRTWASR